MRKTSLDKDLRKIERLEDAVRSVSRNPALGIALLFLAIAGILASSQIGTGPNALLLVVAAVIGGYMALTIGANDVANNVGPAVGARANHDRGADYRRHLRSRRRFDRRRRRCQDDLPGHYRSGADPPRRGVRVDHDVGAAGLRPLGASRFGAPVSTTHAIIGGILGSGIAAMGTAAVDWVIVSAILFSWLLSPMVGGLVAALFLAFIKTKLIYQEDKIAAARRWVPALVGLMAAVFSAYLVAKGLNRVWRPGLPALGAVAGVAFAIAYLLADPWVRRQSDGMENRNQSLRKLFNLPLICSAALLSFAHGSNDVANAVGPLAAILHSVNTGSLASEVGVPFWVMLIGSAGISLGLFLFGPRIVRIVGAEITKMNPMRAFCVALSAGMTVLVASQLGLPVSTTHIVVGGVFGVGFFREYYTTHSRRRRNYLRTHKRHVARAVRADDEELQRRKLVRRSHLMGIVAAWAITVPSAAALAALIFFAVEWAG